MGGGGGGGGGGGSSVAPTFETAKAEMGMYCGLHCTCKLHNSTCTLSAEPLLFKNGTAIPCVLLWRASVSQQAPH